MQESLAFFDNEEIEKRSKEIKEISLPSSADFPDTRPDSGIKENYRLNDD